MASFNRVILLGNITRDIEIKYLQSGMAVTELGLAVNDRRKNQQGEWVEETTFVDVTMWGRTAEVAGKYLGKGSPVLIEGRLKLDQWETDGQKRSQAAGRLRTDANDRAKGGGGGGGGGGRGGNSGGAPSFDESEYGEPAGMNAPPARSNRPAASAPPPQDDIPF